VLGFGYLRVNIEDVIGETDIYIFSIFLHVDTDRVAHVITST
jgi:hypothetical protein